MGIFFVVIVFKTQGLQILASGRISVNFCFVTKVIKFFAVFLCYNGIDRTEVGIFSTTKLILFIQTILCKKFRLKPQLKHISMLVYKLL